MLPAHQHNWMVLTVLTTMKIKIIFVCSICLMLIFMRKFAFLLMTRWCSVFHYFCVKQPNPIYLRSVMFSSWAPSNSCWWSVLLSAHWRSAISCLSFNEYWRVWRNLCFRCHQEMINTVGLRFHRISNLLIQSHIHSNIIWALRGWSLLAEVEYVYISNSRFKKPPPKTQKRSN